MPARKPVGDQKAIFFKVKEAQMFAEKVTAGVLKGTYTLKDAEAAFEKLFEVNDLALRELKGYGRSTELLRRIAATKMKDLQQKHAKLNSPEYKAQKEERAKRREAKAADAAREGRAKAAAAAEEHKAIVAAKVKESEAERRLRETEAGVLQGTHTFEQLEVDAREFFSLKFDGGGLSAKFSGPGFFERLSKPRAAIAERRMREVHKAVLAGTHSLEDAEEATTAFYRLRAVVYRRPVDEVGLKTNVAREMSDLRRDLKRNRARQEKEMARSQREAKRTEAIRTKLAAQASDDKLSPAKRAAAKAKLEEPEREETKRALISRLNVALDKHRFAAKEAEWIVWGVLREDYGTARADKALEAEAEALRELQNIEKEVFINNHVRQRIGLLKERVVWKERRKETSRTR